MCAFYVQMCNTWRFQPSFTWCKSCFATKILSPQAVLPNPKGLWWRSLQISPVSQLYVCIYIYFCNWSEKPGKCIYAWWCPSFLIWNFAQLNFPACHCQLDESRIIDLTWLELAVDFWSCLPSHKFPLDSSHFHCDRSRALHHVDVNEKRHRHKHWSNGN